MIKLNNFFFIIIFIIKINLDLASPADCDNYEYSIILHQNLYRKITLIVKEEKKAKKNIDFNNIFYIKNGSIYNKKNTSLGDKDDCFIVDFTIYYVLSALYNNLGFYDYLSYLESIGQVNKNTNYDTLLATINERHYAWKPKKNHNNYFNHCKAVTKRLIAWLKNNYPI